MAMTGFNVAPVCIDTVQDEAAHLELQQVRDVCLVRLEPAAKDAAALRRHATGRSISRSYLLEGDSRVGFGSIVVHDRVYEFSQRAVSHPAGNSAR